MMSVYILNKLNHDPTFRCYNLLFDMWVEGKQKRYVTEDEARKVMGVTLPNNKYTSPHYKPGTPYFCPMLKIHKVKGELVPGVEPPARLITALQEGVTIRSDIFIAKSYIQNLEKDYCKDLVKDTNETLVWLEYINNTISKTDKQIYKSFTFDYKSLYDSLKPCYVEEALKEALHICRPDWDDGFKNWLVKLVNISITSASGKFEGEWYMQKKWYTYWWVIMC